MGSLVLVVEDERKVRELLRRYLERAGLEVLTTESGAEAITLAAQARPDLVVLDLGLPDVPGDVVAVELRRTSEVPIVMLTARSGEEDRIRGLELGADDYVTKPFSPREVVLRVQAVLRRGAPERTTSSRVSYGSGELVIDDERHEAFVRGQQVQLTPTEWGLLLALARFPGRVYSRLELINHVRGYEFEGYERTIDSHVKNLRHRGRVGGDGRLRGSELGPTIAINLKGVWLCMRCEIPQMLQQGAGRSSTRRRSRGSSASPTSPPTSPPSTASRG